MRKGLYRGKRLDNGKWIYGCLLVYEKRYFVIPSEELKESEIESKFYWQLFEKIDYEVDPETVGQYVGKVDKDGTLIFEDDILQIDFKREYGGMKSHPSYIGFVRFEDGAFGIYQKGKGTQFFFQQGLIKTVLGNIHDNSELLNQEA